MDKKEYQRNFQRKYYKERREHILKLMGGKCVKCNNIQELEFDHIDHKKKNFHISKILKCSDKFLNNELKLCQILCKKCHFEKTKLEGSNNKNRAKGTSIRTAKLNQENVLEIKKMLSEGKSHASIAKIYNVRRETISLIFRGITWKHVIF